ncbi:MAG: hypothetical protein IBX55_01125 [Methyloprofundus sp.]|nr:hypothetical protein [Methyloprofundus sp.]
MNRYIETKGMVHFTEDQVRLIEGLEPKNGHFLSPVQNDGKPYEFYIKVYTGNEEVMGSVIDKRGFEIFSLSKDDLNSLVEHEEVVEFSNNGVRFRLLPSVYNLTTGNLDCFTLEDEKIAINWSKGTQRLLKRHDEFYEGEERFFITPSEKFSFLSEYLEVYGNSEVLSIGATDMKKSDINTALSLVAEVMSFDGKKAKEFYDKYFPEEYDPGSVLLIDLNLSDIKPYEGASSPMVFFDTLSDYFNNTLEWTAYHEVFEEIEMDRATERESKALMALLDDKAFRLFNKANFTDGIDTSELLDKYRNSEAYDDLEYDHEVSSLDDNEHWYKDRESQEGLSIMAQILVDEGLVSGQDMRVLLSGESEFITANDADFIKSCIDSMFNKLGDAFFETPGLEEFMTDYSGMISERLKLSLYRDGLSSDLREALKP